MGGALVTGSAGGIGLATARLLADRGYEVVVSDLDADKSRQAADAIGRGTKGIALDVTDTAACRAAAASVVEAAGSLDVWVNNAGVLVTGKAQDQSIDDFRSMIEVNYLGTVNGTLAALDVMRKADRGTIVNVVSLAGLIAAPGEVAYSASKHAALAFTLGTLYDLRRSGEDTVDLCAICPDGVWTPMIAPTLDDPDAMGSFSGGAKLGPDDVAQAIGRAIARPRPVTAVPRHRGAQLRLVAAFPRLSLKLMPLLLRDAARKQARFAKRVASGQIPPPS